MSLCKHKDCKKFSSFGYQNENIIRYCKEHKEPYMINLKLKNKKNKCICGKNPYYGYKGEKPKFCAVCKDPDDENIINVVDKSCEECDKMAFYTTEGSGKFYCGEHKSDGMTNFKKKHIIKHKCECGKIYNQEKFKKNETEDAFCCYTCYIKNQPKLTQLKGYCHCRKAATFGFSIATHCKVHKEPGMTDIKNFKRKCKCGSGLQILYGYFENNSNPVCCRICKTEDMVDIHNFKSRCGCEKNLIAIYGYETDKKATCCVHCKKEDMRNIRDPICNNKEGMCQLKGNRKYKGYCTFCFSHLFPNDPLTSQIQQKTKELVVRDFINQHYDGFIHDKPIYLGDGCNCTNRRRIDLRKIVGNTMIAIECDEEQHKRYDKKDEEARYNDMYMVFSGKWHYIRYNPDAYKDKKGHRRNPPTATRLNALKKVIDDVISTIEKEDHDDKELVSIQYMYYDE